MKTDGLGRGPASWGRLHPFLLARLPRPHLSPPFSFFFTFFPFEFGFAFYVSFSFFTLELYSSCSLSLYGLTETGREEPSFSPSQTCPPCLPAFPLPRPLALSGLPAPMTNFAVTAWGFALVKCTNVPKGQLRMCLVGEGSGFSFFFFFSPRELPFPSPSSP